MREVSSGNWRHVRESGGVAYIMAGDVYIATVNTTEDGKDNETRLREAFGNGEVMAASSALLVACKELRRQILKMGDFGDGPEHRDGYPRFLMGADAIIDRAEKRLDWPPVIERVHVKDTSFEVRDDPSLPPLSREG